MSCIPWLSTWKILCEVEGPDLWGIAGYYEKLAFILLRRLITPRLSFPRRRGSRKTLDAGSSPA
jgi:hypothetical protein